MQKIVPHLWFDKEAAEAAAFYASVFPESRVSSVTTMEDTPSGDADMVIFELWGQKFMAISAGPIFKPNPSISFMVNFDPLFFDGSQEAARAKIDEVWNKLIDGGKALMQIDEYPFSKRYGWVEDKYGVSWQLILTNPDGEPRSPIIHSLMFVGDQCGRAEEAINYYCSVFTNAKLGSIHYYPEGMAPDKPGTVMFADFKLEDAWFSAMDSAHEHKFKFDEGVSIVVNCEDQAELDYFTQKLSAVPEAEQCGWIKDKFGLSWQITPIVVEEMMVNGTREQVNRITQALLPMKRLEIAPLVKAFEGE
ncbi:Glyoxalase superfamily enzyme, possibly 3-demethylubiquinone-9 3-methyltransferase [Dyadobacter sp. SG02]|uniref:VOC family protein n=1 Tax=Dyadobacter sp. SG02 TaxID=1855291 RepID=UPI0008BC1387|nr:VOC family protein [Dyadobacter sp. SG02]SEJ58380.1 Glyoxalase superfamily enzyme, possibly 3-demethylubiquinone-9 3-methyltransferase [Dyadobacter sp. SG02]